MANEICVLGRERETVARVVVGAAVIVAETGKWTRAILSLEAEGWEGVIVYGEIEDDACCGYQPEEWQQAMNNVQAHRAVYAAREVVGDIHDEDFLVLYRQNDVLSAYYKAETNLALHKEDQPELEELSTELVDCLDAYLAARAQLLLQSRRRALETLVILLLEQGELDQADVWEAMEDDLQAAQNSCDQAEAASAG